MKRVYALSLLLFCCLAAVAVHSDRVRLGESLMQTHLIRKVDPVYPAETVRIAGTVVLQANISKAGDVESLKLISGHPILAPAAIDAVKQWKYRPYLLNGWPVAVETTITVKFTRSGKTPAKGVVGSVPGGIPPGEPGGISNANNSAAPPGHPLIPVPQRVRVSAAVEAALLLKKVPPQYPPEAKAKHIEGTVLLHAFIDTQGNVAHLELISGHPLLAPAAIEAVKQWKYKPYLLNNEAIEVETQIKVDFTLSL